MKLNLTTQIESVHSNRLTAFSNLCLRPAAYLLEGRKVTLYKGEVVHFDRAYPEKSWMKTALAIAAFIPATILGAISRLIECLRADLRSDHMAVSNIRWPIVVTDDMSLTKAFKIVYKKGEALTYKYPAEISEYMQDARKQIDILYRELRIEATNELAALQKRLGPVACDTIESLLDPEHVNAKALATIEQKMKESEYPEVLKHYEEKKSLFRKIAPDAQVYYEFLQKCKGNKEKLTEVMMANILEDQLKPYCEKYFYNALTTVYHTARIKMDTIQDDWRATYNRFCEQFNQVREYMTDERFANWSQPDFTGERLEGYPDTQPTLFPKFYD